MNVQPAAAAREQIAATVFEWQLGLHKTILARFLPPIKISVEVPFCIVEHSSRFATSREVNMLTSVTLLPGRLRLATSPTSTGSLPVMKTIGIVAVAALAANAGGLPPVAKITAT